MKTNKARPTRKALEARGAVPETHRCTGCAFVGSKFALKSHKEATGHGR